MVYIECFVFDGLWITDVKCLRKEEKVSSLVGAFLFNAAAVPTRTQPYRRRGESRVAL